MILVDSDVFLIDLRYRRDKRFGSNLLEVCGVLSFNLNRQQLRELYSHFAQRFHVRVLPNAEPRQRLPSFRVGDILSIIDRRVSFGDALVFALLEAQEAEDTTFVTWNTRHFRGRSEVDVREPPAAL